MYPPIGRPPEGQEKQHIYIWPLFLTKKGLHLSPTHANVLNCLRIYFILIYVAMPRWMSVHCVFMLEIKPGSSARVASPFYCWLSSLLQSFRAQGLFRFKRTQKMKNAIVKICLCTWSFICVCLWSLWFPQGPVLVPEEDSCASELQSWGRARSVWVWTAPPFLRLFCPIHSNCFGAALPAALATKCNTAFVIGIQDCF